VALVLVVAQPGLTLAQDGSWLPGIGNMSSSLSLGDQLRDGNDNWWGGFGDPSSSPGTNGTVFAVASYQGRLVVGGGFSTAGGIYVSNVAMWDGAAWVGLGNGLNSTVYALGVYGDRLIAAGDFTQSGTTTVSRIAQWDGVTWSPLGAGMDGTVRSLCLYGGELVAGGDFLQAGGLQANRIARWNGSSWGIFSVGVNNTVSATAVYNGNLVVGGYFDQAGTVSASRVAFWDGTDWYRMSTGLNGTVRALYSYGGELIAGGDFTSYLAKWNGAVWSVLGGGADNAVCTLGSYEGDLIAGGYFNYVGGTNCRRIGRWNGTNWSQLGSGTNYGVFAITQIGTYLLVGGEFNSAGGQSAYYVARWDGSAWSGLASRGLSGSCSAVLANADLAYLGGDFSSAGGSSAQRVARWNGAAFSALSDGMNSLVTSLASLGADVYAGGTFTSAGGSTALSIARWSGSSWSSVGGGMNHNVRALTTWSNSIIAGGEFTVAGSTSANRVARWDGSNWYALGAGTDGPVYALAQFGSGLAVGGSFTNAGGQSASYVAVWDGSTWTPLPGLNGVVRSLYVHQGVLIAGGDFTDGANLRYIAQWTGTSWTPVGTGMSGTVRALTSYDGRLIAGGSFTQAGGATVNNIAGWDGASWSSLGAGANNTVRALSPYGSVLLVGGDFTTAGGKPSYNIARWTASSAADLQIVDVQWSPATPYPNMPVQVRALVRNAGLVTAGPSTTRIWVDGEAVCDLAIGTVYGSQDTWTDWCQVDPLAIGTHSVEACADVLNEVQEAFEDNNCRTEDLEIAVPDAYYIPEGLSFNAGDTNVEIPIRLRYSQEFYRYELRLTYDPTVFSFRDYSFSGTRVQNLYDFDYNYLEGALWFRVYYRWNCPGVPPGDGIVLKLYFDVNQSAAGGPTSFGFADADGYYNRVYLCDGSAPTPALLGGSINIVPLAPYEINAISDIGNDQGRRVRLRWNAEWNDREDAGYPIVSYDIFRRIDANLKHSIAPAPGSVEDNGLEQLRYPPGDWDFVKSVPASGELEYSTICETLCDSTIVDGVCWSTFFVRAKTSQPTMFFDTPPDSGYSVDNLAPGVPQGLRNEGRELAWTPNQEDDFSYYSVYASTDAEFDPMTDTLLGRTAESSFTLEGVDPVFVHVAATDFAGNQGGAATMAMPSAANDPEQVLRWDLSLVGENPSRDRARIRYEVPRSARIEVSVFDAAGRIVAVLVDEARPPGRFEATWDGRDVSGGRAASGVYFCRLRAPGVQETKKILLTR
jgi:hypothetical protein